MHKAFSINVIGRDFIVGDIHSCFDRLQAHLNWVGFDTAVDLLFSVGDLDDRGPQSEQALKLLGWREAGDVATSKQIFLHWTGAVEVTLK